MVQSYHWLGTISGDVRYDGRDLSFGRADTDASNQKNPDGGSVKKCRVALLTIKKFNKKKGLETKERSVLYSIWNYQ